VAAGQGSGWSRHLAHDGDVVYACKFSLQGIMSKLIDAPYKSGRCRRESR
jgi:hypothetical protein